MKCMIKRNYWSQLFLMLLLLTTSAIAVLHLVIPVTLVYDLLDSLQVEALLIAKVELVTAMAQD